MNPIDDELKLDEINLQEKPKGIDLNKLRFPIINVRRTSHLAESTLNYFGLGIGFFIYGMVNLDWFKSKDNIDFICGYYLFVCLILYITSLYDWYQGRTISLAINFLFGSLFLIYYLNLNAQNEKLEGVFYILIFSFLFFVDISMKDDGIIYIIDFVILFVGMVFQFVATYWKNSSKIDYIMKARNYIFIINGALFWITGIIKLLFDLSSWSNRLAVPPI